MENWRYSLNGQPAGPATEEELASLLNEGHLTSATLVWKPGLANWIPLSEALPHLVTAPAAEPPSLPPVPPPAATPPPPPSFPAQTAVPAPGNMPPPPPSTSFPPTPASAAAFPPPPPPVSSSKGGCVFKTISILVGVLAILLGGIKTCSVFFPKRNATSKPSAATPAASPAGQPAENTSDLLSLPGEAPPSAGITAGSAPAELFPPEINGYRNLTAPYKKGQNNTFIAEYEFPANAATGAPARKVTLLLFRAQPGDLQTQARAAAKLALQAEPKITGTNQKFYTGTSPEGETTICWGQEGWLFNIFATPSEGAQEFVIRYYKSLQPFLQGEAGAQTPAPPLPAAPAATSTTAGGFPGGLFPATLAGYQNITPPYQTHGEGKKTYYQTTYHFPGEPSRTAVLMVTTVSGDSALEARSAVQTATGKTPKETGTTQKFYTGTIADGRVAVAWGIGKYLFVSSVTNRESIKDFLIPFYTASLPVVSGEQSPVAGATTASTGGEFVMPASVGAFSQSDSKEIERTNGREYRANYQDSAGRKVMFQVLVQKEQGSGAKVLANVIDRLTKDGWKHVDEDEDLGVTINFLTKGNAICVNWATGSGMGAAWGENKQAIQDFVKTLASRNGGTLVLPGTL